MVNFSFWKNENILSKAVGNFASTKATAHDKHSFSLQGTISYALDRCLLCVSRISEFL